MLEETSMAKDVRAFVTTHAVLSEWTVPPGTIWPRSRMHWLPATAETLNGLARLSESHAEPEICDHLYGVHNGHLVLVWNDVFDDPVYLSSEIPEDRVRAFAETLGRSARVWSDDITEKAPSLPMTARRMAIELAIVLTVCLTLDFAFWLSADFSRFVPPSEGPWQERVILAAVTASGPLAMMPLSFLRVPALIIALSAISFVAAALHWPAKRPLRWLAYAATAIWFLCGFAVAGLRIT